EDGIRDGHVTGVQTCALPICSEITLPIAAEIDARLVAHRERNHAINLAAVRIAPMILAPSCLLREADQIGTGDVMMMADLTPARSGERRVGREGGREATTIGR